jgi:hypothetical protein
MAGAFEPARACYRTHEVRYTGDVKQSMAAGKGASKRGETDYRSQVGTKGNDQAIITAVLAWERQACQSMTPFTVKELKRVTLVRLNGHERRLLD